jgi:hypothetical protein
MEKPTGVIQKIIESLQQVNALDVYSPIEKDIILHNLRAAYMIFMSLPVDESSAEVRVERLFVEEDESTNARMDESAKEVEVEDNVEEEMIDEIEEVEEIKEVEEVEEIIYEEPIEVIEEILTPEPSVEEIPTPEPLVPEAPLVANDDILEFIPDAKVHSSLFFDETAVSKPEKKSLNDLLTEKKDDNSIGNMFQQTPIPDLTKAIAINEKFSFIKELFNNSGIDFSNSIQKLNECENIESAFLLMEELKHQYFWDTTSSTYLSLCDLVRRRFL